MTGNFEAPTHTLSSRSGKNSKESRVLIDVLSGHAVRDADKVALSYLDRGESLADTASYGDLLNAAKIVGSNLAALGLRSRPVVLALPQRLDYVRCFLGCLCAGAVAVPAPLPLERRSAARFASIVRAARPKAVISTEVVLADRRRLHPFIEPLDSYVSLLDIKELSSGSPTEIEPPSATEVAFLQYTSGSVSNPKGVVITHQNLLSNLAMIRDAFKLEPTKQLVSWLPLHHDMGLIGCVLEPLFAGFHSVLMSPLAFLQRPHRWLRAIDTYRATTTGAPNFAYDLCARQIGEAEARKFDLSSLELAFCGSEPIRGGSLRRFADRFAVSGLNPNALLACYGQAEATLLVSSTQPGAGIDRRAIRIGAEKRDGVSCGRPTSGSHVAIVTPSGALCLEGAGEICVAGDHVSPGFWDGDAGAVQADLDREIIENGRRYLRTGDVGVIENDDVYIVGRLREMIIVHGLNVHAEDIEATVLEFENGRWISAAAAFALLFEDREELVIVCELNRVTTEDDPTALRDKLCAAVAEAHGVAPSDLVLVEAGGLERTTSGKVQRGATRERFRSGTLERVAAQPRRRHRELVS